MRGRHLLSPVERRDIANRRRERIEREKIRRNRRRTVGRRCGRCPTVWK